MCQGLICRRCALTNSRRTRAFYYVLKQPCLHLAQAPPERALVTTASQPFLSFLQGPRLVEFATRNTKRWKRGKERERASETRFERFALCTKRSEFPCWVDAQRSGSTFLSLSCQHWKASPPLSPWRCSWKEPKVRARTAAEKYTAGLPGLAWP